jgi:predicted metal-dependent enzyme (double-stranded beta helix superfamily)
MTFDADTFVAECRAALLDDEPSAAVSEIVATAVKDGAAIDDVLGVENPTYPFALCDTDDLTVQRITWWPGYRSMAHEHRMWAVVGVYAGVEVNRLFRRTTSGIELVSTHEIGVGEVIALDETAVHSVENPTRVRTAGIHVYGGPILTRQRSAWGPDGREQPFEEHAALESSMFRVLRGVAADAGIVVDDDSKYAAMRALVMARERAGRYLTESEIRAVVSEVVSVPDG